MSGAQGQNLSRGWPAQEAMFQILQQRQGDFIMPAAPIKPTFTFGQSTPFHYPEQMNVDPPQLGGKGIKGKDWDTLELRPAASGNMFGLGGASAPPLIAKTRCLFIIPILNTSYQLNKPITIIGYRIKTLAWSPTNLPSFDANTGFILLSCSQLANVNSTWGSNRSSAIASWNLSPNLNSGPPFVSEEKDVYLNQATELSRLDFVLYNGSGSPITLTTNNAVNLVIEFILPN